MPARSRQDLLDEAFYRVELRVGTQYPCRQRDLDIIRQRPAYDGGPFVSSRRATLEIVEHNDPRRRSPSSYEREAIYRLSDAMRAADRHPWGPDLVIKAFLDLDLVFFRGALRGYVRISWKDREHFSDGRLPRGILAYTKDNESWLGHAHIYLNAEAILLGSRPFMVMFSTVLHEMCVSIINGEIKLDNSFFA